MRRFIVILIGLCLAAGVAVGIGGVEYSLLISTSIAAVFLVYICFTRPRTFFLVFLFLSFSIQYAERVQVFGGYSLLDIVGVLMPLILLLGSGAIRRPSLSVLQSWYLVFLAATLPGLVIGHFLYGSVFESLTWWMKIFNGFAALVFAEWVFSRGASVRRSAKAILFGLALPASIGIWQYSTGEVAYIKRGLQFVDAGFHHPGEIAYDLVFTIPLALYLLSTSKRRRRVFWAALLGVLCALIAFTFRRNVWIGLLVIALTWAITTRNWRLLALLIVIGICLSNTNIVRESFDDFALINPFSDLPTFERDVAFSGRIGIFRGILRGYADSPLINKILGNGLGSTPYLATQEGYTTGGHNNYLVVLADAGVIGLAAYFILLGCALFVGIRLRSSGLTAETRLWGSMFICLWIGYSVMGFGTHSIFQLVTGQWLFWSLAGSVIALYRHSKSGDY